MYFYPMVQPEDNMELSVIPEPPPYTPVASVLSPMSLSSLPPYSAGDVSTRDGPTLYPPMPPAYDEHMNTPPPTYDSSVDSGFLEGINSHHLQ